MRALGFYLANVALEAAARSRPRVPEPADERRIPLEDRIAVWRQWRLAGEREEASLRSRGARKLPVSRPFRAGPWLPLILGTA
jgi:hypothetical protein